jgi:hypothetical protein
MRQFSDQILAKRLLETRDRGYSFALFVRQNTKTYLLIVSYFVLGLVALALLRSWTAFYLLLGMFVGCFVRDGGWVRQGGKTWPFRLKVIDWDRVQRIADDKGGGTREQVIE